MRTALNNDEIIKVTQENKKDSIEKWWNYYDCFITIEWLTCRWYQSVFHLQMLIDAKSLIPSHNAFDSFSYWSRNTS